MTGQPNPEALGIERSSSAGIYETEEPRTVRIVLPDRVVEVEALVVDQLVAGRAAELPVEQGRDC